MLVLFETPAGFALFKVLDEGKLSKVEDIWKEFSTSESARKVVKLQAFSKFENVSEALSSSTLLIDSKPSKDLRDFLRAHSKGEVLAVADYRLGRQIMEKLKIDCLYNNAVMELMRGVRSQLTELISGVGVQDLAPMSLALSHSLSRFKLKFSRYKAHFRALKTKHAAPKYGLIFHESLVGQAAPEMKGKISHSLAAKTALAIQYDALGDGVDNSMGLENQAKLEAHLRVLEGRELGRSAGSAKGKPKIEVYDKDRKKGGGALITDPKTYNPSSNLLLGRAAEPDAERSENGHEPATSKKRKHEGGENAEQAAAQEQIEEDGEKRKKKKMKAEPQSTGTRDDGQIAVSKSRNWIKRRRRRKRRRKQKATRR